MRIAHQNTPGNGATSTTTDALDAAPAHADIGFFNAQLATPNPAQAPVTGTSALAERSNQLHTLSNRVTKGMRDMSMNRQSKEFRQITKALSEAHQQLAVSVKVVNKSVQMVEKLTNLQ